MSEQSAQVLAVGVGSGGWCGLAIPSPVVTDHAMVPGEQLPLRIPTVARQVAVVDKHQRRTCPGGFVEKAGTANVEETARGAHIPLQADRGYGPAQDRPDAQLRSPKAMGP